MNRIAIIGGVRTPFIKAFTEFNEVPSKELARVAAGELIERLDFPRGLIDEVILGTVATTTDSVNIARVVSVLIGIPESKRAMTVCRNCASGIESVLTAHEKITAGTDSVVLAGGTESMSNVPFLYHKKIQNFFVNLGKMKWHEKLVNLWRIKGLFFSPVIGLKEALTDPLSGLNMGETAEVLVRDFGISRKEQDEFALSSHQKAAQSRDKFKEEIVPVYPGPDYKKAVEADNGIRENQSFEALAKLKPFFDRKAGTITAGNSSQITDGACAFILMKEEEARSLGYDPLGFIKGYSTVGVEPKRMGMGPFAIPSALKQAGLSLKDIELFEINEAFAAQVIACLRALESERFCKDQLGLASAVGEIKREKLNVNGGAIALGHPVGASGARLILNLLLEMKRRHLKYGLVSLCIGGGQGTAVVFERG